MFMGLRGRDSRKYGVTAEAIWSAGVAASISNFERSVELSRRTVPAFAVLLDSV
jgi:hypothetical protein